jgi:hypothetical protein
LFCNVGFHARLSGTWETLPCVECVLTILAENDLKTCVGLQILVGLEPLGDVVAVLAEPPGVGPDHLEGLLDSPLSPWCLVGLEKSLHLDNSLHLSSFWKPTLQNRWAFHETGKPGQFTSSQLIWKGFEPASVWRALPAWENPSTARDQIPDADVSLPRRWLEWASSWGTSSWGAKPRFDSKHAPVT